MTTIVNLYKEKYTVYIGRANNRLGLKESKFHNPFHIGRDGDREEVIRKYIAYLKSHPELVRAAKVELKNQILGCFCAPQLCHGDVLVAIVNDE